MTSSSTVDLTPPNAIDNQRHQRKKQFNQLYYSFITIF